jgi:hypothetical protein
MTLPARSVSALWLYFGGPIVWAAHFFLLYGIEVLICTGFGTSSLAQRFWIVALALTALALVLLCFMAWHVAVERSDDRRGTGIESAAFYRPTSIGLAVLAMFGVLWATLPALLLPACAAGGPAS